MEMQGGSAARLFIAPILILSPYPIFLRTASHHTFSVTNSCATFRIFGAVQCLERTLECSLQSMENPGIMHVHNPATVPPSVFILFYKDGVVATFLLNPAKLDLTHLLVTYHSTCECGINRYLTSDSHLVNNHSIIQRATPFRGYCGF
jgi:hypothetical protein